MSEKLNVQHILDRATHAVDWVGERANVNNVTTILGGAALFCAVTDFKDGRRIAAALEFGAGLFIANTNMFVSGSSTNNISS